MKLIPTCFAALLIAFPLVAADLESALKNLKDAEAQKDVPLVKKLAAETSAQARDVLSAPKPDNDEAIEIWKQRQDYARDVETYTEYALYAVAVQSPPETLIDLVNTLELQNPKSKYLNDAWARYFVAMQQSGAGSKIPEVATKAIANFADNEDLLLVLADNALAKQQRDRALSYSERLITALNKHGRPEWMSAADWERKKSAALGRGYWIAGVMHSDKNQYFEANKDLRAALPLVKGNEVMLATALFHLGVANYQLGRMTVNKGQVMEGVKFSEQAAAIPGSLQSQAWRNAQVMKTEAAKMR
jgi:tetratricopeptide (TPR) repeat protein